MIPAGPLQMPVAVPGLAGAVNAVKNVHHSALLECFPKPLDIARLSIEASNMSPNRDFHQSLSYNRPLIIEIVEEIIGKISLNPCVIGD